MSRLLPRNGLVRILRCALLTTIALQCGCAGSPPVKPAGDAERSRAAFVEMAKVLTHPRCLNCHAQGDGPTQGDAMVAHEPPVQRGTIGMGGPGMRCSTCHTEANVPFFEHAGSVPGAPAWQLAPASMAWQGKSIGDICQQLTAGAGDGGESLEQIYERNRTDPVTGWAWAPGAGRTPAPGTQEEFARQTRVWIDNGAHCPEN